MAKRKKRTGRRRRVGAAALSPSSPLVQLGSLALGYFVAAPFINDAIDKVAKGSAVTVPATTNKIVGAAEAGLGGFLVLSKRKRSLLKTVAGGVLAGSGLKRLLTSFGVVSGFQQVPVVGRRMIRGFRDVPVVGGGPSMSGYTPTGSNALTGYNIGKSVSSQIMGSASDGSGLLDRR